MSDDTYTIKQGNEEMEVSLADIAGIDMNDVEEFEGGFEPTPVGVYTLGCRDAGLDELAGKAVIYFTFEIEVCHAIIEGDSGKDEDSIIGWEHKETIFIGDLAKSVGQAKAIMSKAGFRGQGSLQELLDEFVGTSFIAPIKHRTDKNDKDRIYSNIVIKKIQPATREEAGTDPLVAA